MIFMSQRGITDPAQQAAWDHWYQAHVAMMLTVKGIESAQRFTRIHGTAAPPGQQQDGPAADAGEGDPNREAALAHKPMGQKQCMPNIADKDAATDHEHPDGEVQVPWVTDSGGQHHPATDQDHAERHNDPGPHAVHQHPQQRCDEGGSHEAHRKGAGCDPALPPKLGHQGWEEERERRAGIDPNPHRDKGDRHDDPAVKKGPAPIGPQRDGGWQRGWHVVTVA